MAVNLQEKEGKKSSAESAPLSLKPGLLRCGNLLFTQPKGPQDTFSHHDIPQLVHMAAISGQLVLDVPRVTLFTEHVGLPFLIGNLLKGGMHILA
jgi:hypothetical protein